MQEFNEYEKAVIKYSKSLDINIMPLNSWDVFASHYETLKKSLLDLKELDILSKQLKWKGHFDVSKELYEGNVVVVTDVNLNIVFASKNIIKMTGYSFDEVLGKSPKMFQGEATSKEELQEMREAINLRKPFEKTIVNYKKNGEIYHCHIKAFPVFNHKKEFSNFIAFEKAA